MSENQNYFECIIKKHQKVTDNPPIRIYVNKIELYNRIIFKINKWYYLEILNPEAMKLLGGTENVPHIEITEVISVYCNIVSYD